MVGIITIITGVVPEEGPVGAGGEVVHSEAL